MSNLNLTIASKINQLQDIISFEKEIWVSSPQSKTYKAIFKCLMAIDLIIDFVNENNIPAFVLGFKQSKLNSDMILACFRYKKESHSDASIVSKNEDTAMSLLRCIEQEFCKFNQMMYKK